jgi:hypothetical protein
VEGLKDLPVGLNAIPAPEEGAGDAILIVCFAQKRKIFKQIALHVPYLFASIYHSPNVGRFWKYFTRWAECSPGPEDGARDAILIVCFAQKRNIFKQTALHVFVCQYLSFS